jgi:TP901 family phage tail tape measure protein
LSNGEINNVINYYVQGIEQVITAGAVVDNTFKKNAVSMSQMNNVVGQTAQQQDVLVHKLGNTGDALQSNIKHTQNFSKTINSTTGEVIKDQKLLSETFTVTNSATGDVIRSSYQYKDSNDALTESWKTGIPWLDKGIKKLNGLRWAMVNIMFIGALVAAAAAPFVLMTKGFMEIELAAHKLAAATGGDVKNAFEDIVTLSKGTIHATKDVGVSLLEVGKAGYSASQAFMVTRQAQILAIAGFSDLKNSTALMINVLNAYNMEGTSAGYVTDVIARAANSSAADVETFANAISYAAGTAYQANVSLSGLAGMLGILQTAGIRASRAGTSMNAALLAIVSPSAQAQDMLDKLGVSVYDTNRELRDGMDVFDDLISRLGDASNSAQIASEIFGTRGVRAFNAMKNTADATGMSIKELTIIMQASADASTNMSLQMEAGLNRISRACNELKIMFVDTGLSNWFADIAVNVIEGFTYGLDAFRIEYDKTKKEFEEGGLFKKTMVVATSIIAPGLRTLPGISSWQEAADNYHDAQNKIISGDEERLRLVEALNEAQASGTPFEILAADVDLRNYDLLLEYNDKMTEKALEYAKAKREGASQETLDSIMVEYDMIQKVLKNSQEIAHNESMIAFFKEKSNGIEVERLELQNRYLRGQEEELKNMLLHADLALQTFQDEISLKLESSEVKEALGYVEKLTEIYKDLIAQGDRFSDIYGKTSFDLALNVDFAIGQIEQYISLMRALQVEINTLEEALKRQQRVIKQWQDELKSANDVLKDLQSQLRDVQDEINKLSRATFEGEIDFKKRMSDYERYLKRIDFEDMTGMSAFEFINATIGMTNQELQQFLATFEKINEETKKGQDTYDAWRHTVEEFIRASVTAGNDLGMSVSDAVSEYSTLLLSTSMFQDSTNNQSSAVNLLADAYDIYYGDMHDEVQYNIDLHNAAANGIYANAQMIIDALRQHWDEEERLNESMNVQIGIINNLEANLANAREAYDLITQQIANARDQMREYINAIYDAIRAVQELIAAENRRSTQSHAAIYSPTSPISGVTDESWQNTWNDMYNELFPNGWTGLATGGIVTKPTHALIGEAGPEAVIPLDKMGEMGTTITIGDIIIQGNTGSNPQDFAYEFSQELKRELRTI